MASPAKITKPLLEIYHSHRKTFFCGEPFSEKGEVIYHGCPHCPPIKTQIRWMPIVPLEQLAQHFNCFHEKICLNKKGVPFKGLRCCQQTNPYFQQMRVDFHNLVPELPMLYTQRRHRHFGLIAKEELPSNYCQYYVDHKKKLIEPPPQLRGMIARTYLYMKSRYPFLLSPDELALYLQWHQQYPASQWERERSQKIQQYQGNRNPYVI